MSAAPKYEIDKDFHKLMNNAVYGKICENQRKRTDIHLVNDRLKAAKLVDKPHCLDERIFHEKLVGIQMQNVKLLHTKPSYVGFLVLELSKLHMLMYVDPTYHHITSLRECMVTNLLHQHTQKIAYSTQLGSTTMSSRRGMGKRPTSSSQIPILCCITSRRQISTRLWSR